MFGAFSKRDKGKIIRFVRQQYRKPLSDIQPQRRKPLKSVRVFPVKMINDGGSDGTSSSDPTWTYTVKDENGDIEFATAVDPSADPTTQNGGRVVRRNVSTAVATFGTAHWNGSGFLVIDTCNETWNVGPCA